MFQREGDLHRDMHMRQHRHPPDGSGSDDETELLRLQKDFLSGSQRPAAKATRVTPKRPSGSFGESAVPTDSPSPSNEVVTDNAEPCRGPLSGMLGILTDVQEKLVSSQVCAPVPPTGGAAFPKAPHRKQSKFALSRKQTPNGPAAPSSAPGNPVPVGTPTPSTASATGQNHVPHMLSPASTTDIAHTGNQAAAAASASLAPSAAVAPAGVQQLTENPTMDVTAADQRHIHEENTQLLQSMSPAEVEEARQELLSRLTPEAQAFLARRAAAKQTPKVSTASPTATTAGSRSSTAGASSAEPGAQHVMPNNGSYVTAGRQGSTNKHQAAPGSGVSRSAGSKQADETSTMAGSACRASPAGSAGAPPKLVNSNSASSAVKAVSAGSTAAEGAESGLIARLRFSLEGQVVGLQPPDSSSKGPEAEQQVVQRDILRLSEGSSPEGYTLQEACTLTRSSLIKQRVLALHLLSAVLTAARPQASHHHSQGILQQQLIHLPPLLTQAEAIHGKLTWAQVWEHALQELQVATVLRMLLDDAQTSVVTAAAQALAVLIGPGREEEEVLQAAEDNPSTGCPVMPWRHFERPHAVGAWVCTSLERPQGPPPPGAGLVEEQPQDDGTVATTDPLMGLLRMQLLDRISFLLRSPAAAAAAASPLLMILQTYARAGADAARAVWQCPGMLKALQGLLQNALTPSVDAMALVRLLASSSSQMLKAVASPGLLVHAQRALAVATSGSTHVVEEQLQRLSTQVEALHIWRLCAEHNVVLMHLDDTFPAICRLFDPPPSSSIITQHPSAALMADTTSEGSHVGGPHASTAQLSKAEQLLQKLHLRASCQAFLLLGSLVRHANRDPARAMLSPGSATALVNAALEWLQPQVIQAVTSSLPNSRAHPWPGPYQGTCRQGRAAAAVPAALGPCCSALAAVLQFLEAHIQARQVASDIATIQQTLLSCNLISVSLQTPSTSSSEGLTPALLAVLHTQQLPSSANSPDQQQPDQHEALGSFTMPELHQGQTCLVRAQSAAHFSDVELHSAAELQQGTCEMLYALAALSTVLSQHGAIDEACAGSLYMAVIEALSDQVPTRGAVPPRLLEIQPWASTCMQRGLPQLRLLQYALENAPVTQLTPEQSQHVLQTALALPTVLPPGAEATALRALSTAFQTALLGPALAQACQALHSFQTGASSLAMAAAGLTFEQMQSMHSRQAEFPAVHRGSVSDASQQASAPLTDTTQSSASFAESTGSRVKQQQQQQQEEEQEEEQGGAGQLYPLEPLPDQAICCQRLLQGYSAAWLGLVPAAPASSSAGGGAGPPPAPEALLLQPVGSRLPLPLGYPLMEIIPPQAATPPDPKPPSSTPGQTLHPIPEDEEEATAQQGSSAAAAAEGAAKLDESAALSVGCALLLQLAAEEGFAAHQCVASEATGNKIRHVMEMVFNPEAAANVGSAEELWYHPVVRWTLAALLHRWYAEQPDLSSVQPDGATRWTEHFAALSYGDPLFSLALSPLLSTHSPLHVQVTILQTLADEKCLHLMPPMAVAVLPPTAYSTFHDAPAAGKHTQQPQQHQTEAKDLGQMRTVLQELQQGSLLDRCYASNSLVKDLKL